MIWRLGEEDQSIEASYFAYTSGSKLYLNNNRQAIHKQIHNLHKLREIKVFLKRKSQNYESSGMHFNNTELQKRHDIQTREVSSVKSKKPREVENKHHRNFKTYMQQNSKDHKQV